LQRTLAELHDETRDSGSSHGRRSCGVIPYVAEVKTIVLVHGAFADGSGWTTDEDILWVSLADKVHNARTILRDLRKPDIGEKVWARFNVPTKQTLWYYHSIAEIFGERLSNQLSDELREIVDALKAEADRSRRSA